LRGAEDVKWFRKEHRDWVQAYADPMQGLEALLPAERDYFNYSNQDSAKHSVVNNCRCQTMVHKRRNVEFGRDQS